MTLLMPTNAADRRAVLRDPPDERQENSWIAREVRSAGDKPMKWHCIVFPRDERQERWLNGDPGRKVDTKTELKHCSNASSTKSLMANGVFGKHVEVKPSLFLEQGEDGKLYSHLYFRINPNYNNEEK